MLALVWFSSTGGGTYYLVQAAHHMQNPNQILRFSQCWTPETQLVGRKIVEIGGAGISLMVAGNQRLWIVS